MASVPLVAEPAQPTNLAPLPGLFAYAQGLGLEQELSRPKRGIPTLVLALLWLTLAWRGSGRPERVGALGEPFLAALLGLPRLPDARTRQRSLASFPARAVRAAVEAAYRAELPRRTGRVWIALDAHQVPSWGRGQPDAFQKGWSGMHGRRRGGYRLFLAVDADTGQVVTFLLARGGAADHRLLALLARRCRAVLGRRLAGVVADCGFTSRPAVAALLASGVPFILGFARSAPVKARLAALAPQQRRWLAGGGAVRLGACPWDARLRLFALGARAPTDARGPWVYVTSLRAAGPQRLAATYRRRWRVEQAIEELLNGTDLDHLVGYRLHPNRVAIGFRLLARNLALGRQIAQAGGRPATIREPAAFRAAHVEGLGTVVRAGRTLRLTPLRPTAPPGPPPALGAPHRPPRGLRANCGIYASSRCETLLKVGLGRPDGHEEATVGWWPA
jgi:Transposase DDE domain